MVGKVMGMRGAAVLIVLVMASACTAREGDASPPSEPRTSARSATAPTGSTHVSLIAMHEVPMQIGNLVQKVISVGETVEAVCFAPAPAGYPGPVAKVQSGPTLGFVIIDVNGAALFDVPAKQLEAQLPACGPTSLM